MLDAAAPTRLFSGLPEGVTLERMGLVEAIEATQAFLKLPLSPAEAGVYSAAIPRLAGEFAP
jgi:hypothetical protein